MRASYRADVEPLHEALSTPSPLGSKIDDYHKSLSEDGSGSGHRRLSSISPINIASDYSISKNSIGYSVVSTIVDGVHHSISHWKVLLFGQLISFFLAAAGAMSEELNATCNVHVPLTQLSLVGTCLMFLGGIKMKGWCAGCYLTRRNKKKIDDGDTGEDCNKKDEDISLKVEKDCDIDGWAESDDDEQTYYSPAPARRMSSEPKSFCFGLQRIHAPSWAYFISALVAVEGRFFVVSSFKYTSFSFIYLVQALSIPSAMLFSKILLRRKYLLSHVLGGFICITGVSLSTLSDLKEPSDTEHIGSRSVGDLLAICGAILLGLDDVLSEELVKHHGGVDELLFMKWWFGVGIAITQLAILERDSFLALFDAQGGGTCSLSTQFVLLGLFCLFQVLDLFGEVRFLSISEACLLNLSVLSSNLWASVFTIVTDGVLPAVSYYVALLLIVIGIVLYEAGPSPIHHDTPADIKITKQTDKDETHHIDNTTKEYVMEMT